MFPDQEIGTYEEAVRTAVDHLDVDTGMRNVLVAHQFVTGAVRCESEEVSVGGLDQVGVSVFAPFDYVALGHIHGPQHVGRETVRYCGTPLKYSFSEASQEKSVTVVELFEKGNIKISQIPLKPLPGHEEAPGDIYGGGQPGILQGDEHRGLCPDHAHGRGGHSRRDPEAAGSLSEPDAAGV